MTKWQKQVKTAVANGTTIWPDKVICRKDGSVEMRRGFFYTHGYTSGRWGDDMIDALKAAGVDHGKVESEECWFEWPKDSYWAARVYPTT